MATKLKDSSGQFVTIQAGESCNLTGTLKDTAGATVTPLSFTISLFDYASGVIVNSRKEQDVLNANGGTVTAGVYEVELNGSDTQIVGTLSAGETQQRVARFSYTWSDSGNTRTGVEEFVFPVESLTTALDVGSGASEITVTITDASDNPVGGAIVYLTSDVAGQVIVAGPVFTTSAGLTPTLSVDTGAAYRWASATGYTFTNPQSLTVT